MLSAVHTLARLNICLSSGVRPLYKCQRCHTMCAMFAMYVMSSVPATSLSDIVCDIAGICKVGTVDDNNRKGQGSHGKVQALSMIKDRAHIIFVIYIGQIFLLYLLGIKRLNNGQTFTYYRVGRNRCSSICFVYHILKNERIIAVVVVTAVTYLSRLGKFAHTIARTQICKNGTLKTYGVLNKEKYEIFSEPNVTSDSLIHE